MATILTARELCALAATWRVMPNGTHWEGCWDHHPRCAVARLVASHQAVLAQREAVPQ